MNLFRRRLVAMPNPDAVARTVADLHVARLTIERDDARQQAGMLRIHLRHTLDARDRLAADIGRLQLQAAASVDAEVARLRKSNLELEDMLAACRDLHGSNVRRPLLDPSWAEVDAEKRAGDL